VHARVPAKIQSAFRGRKPYPTQNVMAAVDFDLKFTYVLAGCEGSAHDATILADALERGDGFRVPEGINLMLVELQLNVKVPQHSNNACVHFFREILPSRCWICMSSRVPSSLRRH